MKIHQSAEDYLETILKLKEQLGIVRSIDIANELGYSKPSVSVAMKRLRENGYLEMDKEGYITLKPSGLEIAQRIYERHRVLRCLLLDLGVDEQTAAADACKIEHALSEQSFEKIKELTLERHEALQQQNKE